MKNKLCLVLLFVSFFIFSQQRKVELTHIKTGKVVVFEENQRVKLRTLDKKKWVGQLKIIDQQFFSVDNHKIRIDSLQSIKKQPKALSTAKTVLLVSGGALIGSSILAASSGSDSAFLLFTLGAGTTISSGVIGWFNTTHTSRKWSCKISEK